jgi:hypothetical protein
MAKRSSSEWWLVFVKLNETFVLEHAKVDRRESWHENTHVLFAKVLVVWQLNLNSSDAWLLVDFEQIRKRVVLSLHLRYSCLHKSVQIWHLFSIFFHEIVKPVGAWLCLRSHRYFDLSWIYYLSPHHWLLVEIVVYFCCHKCSLNLRVLIHLILN